MMKNLLSLNNTNPYLLEFKDFQPFGNAVILIVFWDWKNVSKWNMLETV